jgi:hypothetical protein
MECSVVVNKSVYIVFFVRHDSTHLSRLVLVLYINTGPPTGKHILQHCKGLNIPEPVCLILAGESVEELDWI